MNNELLSLTLALVLIEDVKSHVKSHISFDAEDRTAYTTSGLFLKKIAEATGEEIQKRTVTYTGMDGEEHEQTYYEVQVKGWTLHTLQDPDTAIF